MGWFLQRGQDPVIILGAGPTGLGAAYFLTLANFQDWLIYEGSDEVGGLSRSFLDDKNFTWDIGGHVVFSHYDSFTKLLDILMKDRGWFYHQRESWIRILGLWVPYPFQNNIHRLPSEFAAKCLQGLLDATLEKTDAPHTDFEDFICRTFGKGISDLFMRPYNYKVWAYPATQLDTSWIADRVSTPDLKRVLRNMAEQCDDASWGPNNTFRFPKYGGTGSIWKSLASRLPPGKLVLNHEVVELDLDSRIIRFANGAEQKYGTLISSIPLDRLVKYSGKKNLAGAAARLTHSAVNVIGLALRGNPNSELQSKCWMYFPELRTPFNRVTHFSHYSPNNVNDINSQWSLTAEISESPEKRVNHATLVQDTISGLVAEGLIASPDQIEHIWQFRAEYAYPTPFKGRDEVLSSLLIPLDKARVLSRGRFGAWLYEIGNMDHCFMQGFEAASHVLFGTPEFTIWNPHVVNQPHHVLGWNRLNWSILG